MADPRDTIGGNNPPEPIKDPLTIEAEERIATGNRYLTERADTEKWDDDIVQKVNAFISQVTATWNAMDNRRKDDRRVAIEAAELPWKADLDMMLSLKTQLTAKRTTYLKAKEARLLKEQEAREAEARERQRIADEAARKAEEEKAKVGGNPLQAEQAALRAQVAADDAAVEAEKGPEKARTGAGYGAKSTGLRDFWSAEIEDLSEAFKHYNRKAASNPYRNVLQEAVRIAILGIADKEAKFFKDETKAPPGIKFVKDRR